MAYVSLANDTGETMPINVRYWSDGWSFSNR